MQKNTIKSKIEVEFNELTKNKQAIVINPYGCDFNRHYGYESRIMIKLLKSSGYIYTTASKLKYNPDKLHGNAGVYIKESLFVYNEITQIYESIILERKLKLKKVELSMQ